jgi:hypothetical protein
MQTSAAFSIQNKQQISTTFQLEILFMLYARSLQNQVLIPVCRNLPIRAKRQLLAQNDPREDREIKSTTSISCAPHASRCSLHNLP